MNPERLQRPPSITGLRFKAAIRWLIFALEPIGSTEKMECRAEYKTAKRQLDLALLKQREARLNRRVS